MTKILNDNATGEPIKFTSEIRGEAFYQEYWTGLFPAVCRAANLDRSNVRIRHAFQVNSIDHWAIEWMANGSVCPTF